MGNRPTDSNIPADTEENEVSSAGRAGRTVTFHIPAVKVPRPRRPKLTGRAAQAALLVGALLLGLAGGFAGAALENSNGGSGFLSGTITNQKKVVTSESQLVNDIAKTVGPSVVSVNVTTQGSTQDFFGFAQPTQEEAAGTGIIISSDGLVVTNRHVVPTGTTQVSITLSDGTELGNVTVVGRTNASDSLDVAFLKINNTRGHKLTPAILGDSSKVQVGDAVVAIGNALGQFQNTVTSGIISGYGRSVQASDSSGTQSPENLDDLFQTDAAINEGNSGGPLVNLNGQVIGINTAIAGNAQNIGFAIPINDVKGLISQVLKTGKFARPYLGVRYIPLTSDVAQQYDLSVNRGAYVAPPVDATQPSVVPDSPADKAGVKQGDIITQINGTDIDENHSLVSLLDQHAVGDKVSLTVLRDGKTLHLTATLGSSPSS